MEIPNSENYLLQGYVPIPLNYRNHILRVCHAQSLIQVKVVNLMSAGVGSCAGYGYGKTAAFVLILYILLVIILLGGYAV